MQKELQNKIEAILFYIAEPVAINFLIKTLEISKEDTLQALDGLGQTLKERGVRLITHNNEVVLATAPEYSEVVEKMIKEEREGDLGRAGIETLSIIAYKGPVTKKELEYIRGVNSQYALRTLLLRGLIERKNSETDMRSVGYNITSDALRFLGISSVSELPEYEDVRKQLEVTEEKVDEDVLE